MAVSVSILCWECRGVIQDIQHRMETYEAIIWLNMHPLNLESILYGLNMGPFGPELIWHLGKYKIWKLQA